MHSSSFLTPLLAAAAGIARKSPQVTFIWGAVLIFLLFYYLGTADHHRKKIIGTVLTVLVTWNLVQLGIALVNVSEVVLAQVSFNAGDFGFVLMWTASGIGSAAGALCASSWLGRRSTTVVYAAQERRM